MSKSELKVLALLVAIAGMAAAYWYARESASLIDEVPIIALPTPVSESKLEPKVPAYPVGPVATENVREFEPLPSLADSDSRFLSSLIEILGGEVENLLVSEALIDRFVATVDNLPRMHVSEKIRPIGSLSSPFRATTISDSESYVLGAENYERYDVLVDLLSGADVDAIVMMYRHYYPLFQESYKQLGYPDGYFNDRLVEVIDHLLSTPEQTASVELIRPHVLYEFADPALEAMSSGQKLLLRMGNEHMSSVKQTMQALRLLLVDVSVESP